MSEFRVRRQFDGTHQSGKPSAVGTVMTLDDLPSVKTKRWVIRRKAKVVAGVRAGLLSLDEACRRYHLSIDEFLSWQRQLDDHGLEGLRVTRLKKYRDAG